MFPMRSNDLHIRIAAGSALERWLLANSHTTKTQAVHDLATRYEELKRATDGIRLVKFKETVR